MTFMNCHISGMHTLIIRLSMISDLALQIAPESRLEVQCYPNGLIFLGALRDHPRFEPRVPKTSHNAISSNCSDYKIIETLRTNMALPIHLW